MSQRTADIRDAAIIGAYVGEGFARTKGRLPRLETLLTDRTRKPARPQTRGEIAMGFRNFVRRYKAQKARNEARAAAKQPTDPTANQ